MKNAALRYRPRCGRCAAKPAAAQAVLDRHLVAVKDRERCGERKPERTVYVCRLEIRNRSQIKTGISDGVVTEVTEGLKEGDAL
jgi:hypothetical protein